MAEPDPPGPGAPTVSARVLELTPSGPARRYLLVVPAAQVQALRAARLQELARRQAGTAPLPEALQERIAASALAEACRRAGEIALGLLLRRLALPVIGTPRVDTLESPPEGDLVLRVRLWVLPEIALPDPAALRIERLVAHPPAAELEAALAALAARHAALAELPPGTPAEPGDEVVCDIEAQLPPPANLIPQPGLAGAAPGRLPEGWSFGDNGAGLAAEVLLAAPGADPPHIRLRVHGTTASEGQSYLIFHPPGTIRAAAGESYSGSVAVRPVGRPVGLRGSKLRLQSQPASGTGSLRRKDAALTHRGAGFARCYVSDRFIESETAFLRMPLLFDHAAGEVDFTADIGLPRLVEGLDLGQAEAVPLPELSGRGRRLVIGAAADPAWLAPHLPGLAAGVPREVALRLPGDLADPALAGRAAQVTLRPAAVLRRVVPPLDDALARALGHAGLEALRAAVAARVAERYEALSRLQARRALLDALLAAAGEPELPEEAVHAEFAAIWPRLAAAAEQAGTAPPGRETALELARRRLATGLLLGAVARRHGIAAGEGESPEERVVAFLMAQAQVTTREVPPAELLARVDASPAAA